MENVYFSFLINHDTHRFTIIGTLTAEEERNLTQKLKSTHFNFQREVFKIENSIPKEINALQKTYPNYEYVPANELFENIRFLDI